MARAMADADRALFLWINGLAGRSPAADAAMQWLASDYLAPVGIALTLAALWLIGRSAETRQRYQIGVFAALTSMALSNLVVSFLNAFYFRPRPFLGIDPADMTLLMYMPTDSSFPSNSAAAAFAIGATVWLLNRRVGAALLCVAVAYGFSRVYVGVHYPADIAGGALIAAMMTALTLRLRDRVMPVLVAVIRIARRLVIA